MLFKLIFTEKAENQVQELENNPAQKRILKEVRKALGSMQTNLRHPSLNTHEFHGFKGSNGEKVFESYAQQNTPGAYRIFWHYGPDKGWITILLIIPHP